MVLPLEPTEVPGVYRRGSKFVVVYRFTGRGYATEAVQLLVDYLFATKQRYRIHLVIVPENAAPAISLRSAASSWRGRFAARSSTRAETTTCSSTRFCEPTRGPGIPRTADPDLARERRASTTLGRCTYPRPKGERHPARRGDRPGHRGDP